MTTINTGASANVSRAPAPITGGFAPKPQPRLFDINNNQGVPKFSVTVVEELAAPMDLDIGDINQFLARVQQAMTKESTKTAAETIKINKLDQEKISEKARLAQEEATAKAKEAAEAAPNDSFMNWLTAGLAILGAIVAIVATVVTAGAGAPVAAVALTGAVALVAAASAGMAVADAYVKDKEITVTNYDGSKSQMSVSWGGMVERCVDMAMANGDLVEIHKDSSGQWVNRLNKPLDPNEVANHPDKYRTVEEINNIKMACTIVMNVTIMLATMAGGFGAYKIMTSAKNIAEGVAKGAAFAAKAATAAKVERGLEITASAGEVVGGVAGMYAGVQGLEVASLNADTDRARADKAFYDAMLRDLSSRLRMTNESMNQLVSRLNSMYDAMFVSLAASGRTLSTTAHNMT